MKVLCIGHIAFDVTFEMATYPVENTRNEINNIVETGGGSSATAACLLGKWGFEPYICGVIGYDEYSEKIKKEFSNFKVNTDFLEIDYERKTSVSYILLNPVNKSRTILSKKSELSPIKKDDYNKIPIDMILLDGHEYQTSLKTLRTCQTATSILDAGRATKEVLDLCSKVNFIICSLEFAEEVSGIKIVPGDTKTIADLYQNLKKRFIKQEIIVTLEDQGALYAIDGHIKLIPALKLDAKDTTGAGDIFHGAFAYQYAQTKNIEQAVKFANVTAGLSVRNVGSKNSFPELDEVKKYYEQV